MQYTITIQQLRCKTVLLAGQQRSPRLLFVRLCLDAPSWVIKKSSPGDQIVNSCVGASVCRKSTRQSEMWFALMITIFLACWRLGPFYYHGLTLIRARISNHIHYDVWDGFIYPFPNINGVTEKWFNSTFYWAFDYLCRMCWSETIRI